MASPPSTFTLALMTASELRAGMRVSGTTAPDFDGDYYEIGIYGGSPLYSTDPSANPAAFDPYGDGVIGGGGGYDVPDANYIWQEITGGWHIYQFEDGWHGAGWDGTEAVGQTTPDLVTVWTASDDETGTPAVAAIGPADPAALTIAAAAAASQVGMTVSGTLSPAAGGAYILCGAVQDRPAWSSDGALLPPASGTWFRLAYSGLRWQLRTYVDGSAAADYWSAAAGTELLPSSANWTSSAQGAATGTPVVTRTGPAAPAAYTL